MSEQIEEDSKQDSFTIGTPGKGGSLKVYFDLKNLDETQQKLENFLKLKQWLLVKGLKVGDEK